MNYKRFRSRKLLLIITFLLDIHSISLYKLKDFGVPDVKEAPHQSSTRHSDVLWVVDEKSGRYIYISARFIHSFILVKNI